MDFVVRKYAAQLKFCRAISEEREEKKSIIEIDKRLHNLHKLDMIAVRTWTCFYAQSTMKGYIRAKQNVFPPQVKILIHYLILIPLLRIGGTWGKMNARGLVWVLHSFFKNCKNTHTCTGEPQYTATQRQLSFLFLVDQSLPPNSFYPMRS